jgi:tripartite-type tricarboxylate transporter receptor subunit TctC
VPFSPGGSTDVIARLVAREMSKQLGQTVVVENKDGASGAIATDFVAKAAPDGYTMCYCTTGSIAILPLIDAKLSYKPERDLSAVTHAVNQPFVVVVRSNLGVDNFKDLVAMSKSGRKLSFGSPGTATPSHLTGELLNLATGMDMRHVPYRGDTPAVQDMLGGHIDAMMLSAISVKALVESGKVKALAVSSTTRLKTLPELPTIAELGYAGFQTNNLQAIFVPAGTPRPIVDKLNAELKKAVTDPEIAAKLSAQTLDPMHSTPEDFAKLLQSDYDKLKNVVKLSGARID